MDVYSPALVFYETSPFVAKFSPTKYRFIIFTRGSTNPHQDTPRPIRYYDTSLSSRSTCYAPSAPLSPYMIFQSLLTFPTRPLPMSTQDMNALSERSTALTEQAKYVDTFSVMQFHSPFLIFPVSPG